MSTPEQINPVFAAAVKAAGESMARIKKAMTDLVKRVEMEPADREGYDQFAYQMRIARERQKGLDFVRRLGAEARREHYALCSECPVCLAQRRAAREEDE